MRAVARVLSWLLAAGLVAVVVVAVAATRQGYRIEVVRSGSMVPTFAPGDAVLVGPLTGPVVPGEVVTFLHSNRSDDLVTHRVTDVTPAGVVHTKGDANATADVWDVRPGQITGVQRMVLPRLGYAVVFLRDPHGLAAVLCLLAAGLLMVQALLAWRRGRADRARDPLGEQDPVGGSLGDTAASTWVLSSPPPGFGRLAGCPYPCVVVEGSARWPARVFAWQRSDEGWRALVRVTRADGDGRTTTSEQWLSSTRLEPDSIR